MPIIENIDGTFDLRQAQDNEVARATNGLEYHIRVALLDPKKETWLLNPKFAGMKDSYIRVTVTGVCECCGDSYTFKWGGHTSRAFFFHTCPAHRGLSVAAYEKLRLRGKLKTYEDETLRRVKLGGHDMKLPPVLQVGACVVYRDLRYMISSVRDHVSKRTGNETTILDLVGRCVVCGAPFPCSTQVAVLAPPPLRCKTCQEASGFGWRYNPAIHTGATLFLGVDMAGGEDRTAVHDTQTGMTYGSMEEYNQAKGRVLCHIQSK